MGDDCMLLLYLMSFCGKKVVFGWSFNESLLMFANAVNFCRIARVSDLEWVSRQAGSLFATLQSCRLQIQFLGKPGNHGCSMLNVAPKVSSLISLYMASGKKRKKLCNVIANWKLWCGLSMLIWLTWRDDVWHCLISSLVLTPRFSPPLTPNDPGSKGGDPHGCTVLGLMWWAKNLGWDKVAGKSYFSLANIWTAPVCALILSRFQDHQVIKGNSLAIKLHPEGFLPNLPVSNNDFLSASLENSHGGKPSIIWNNEVIGILECSNWKWPLKNPQPILNEFMPRTGLNKECESTFPWKIWKMSCQRDGQRSDDHHKQYEIIFHIIYLNSAPPATPFSMVSCATVARSLVA